MKRPSWDEYFMMKTSLAFTRSTCLRRKVGAILVMDDKILGTGYNGAPSGLKHCAEIGCIRADRNIPSGMRHELCRGIHAEDNAIRQALHTRDSLVGATLFCTNYPCNECAKKIVDEGIKRVVIMHAYKSELAEEMFNEKSVKVEVFEQDVRELIIKTIFDETIAKEIIDLIRCRTWLDRAS